MYRLMQKNYTGCVLGKILNWKTLENELIKWRSQGKIIVFTNGCFDILHRGHVEYLNQAKRLGDILILGLNSDQSVRILKGPGRPFVSEDDRAYILSQLLPVDVVTIFNEETPYNLIDLVRPNILAKGGDYRPDQIVGKDIVEKYGGKVIPINFIKGKSTSGLIERIRS